MSKTPTQRSSPSPTVGDNFSAPSGSPYGSLDREGTDVPLGTARWLTGKEAVQTFSFKTSNFKSSAYSSVIDARSNGQLWLGYSADGQAPLGRLDEEHVFVAAGPRSGKGASVIIPNLLLWPGSCVVIDPKGENARVTASRRGPGSAYSVGMGQKVCVLDPYNVTQLDTSFHRRFNPLDLILTRPERAITIAQKIAASVVCRERDGKSFFVDATISFVTDLILHVATDPIYKERRNLVTVYMLLVRGDWLTHDALVRTAQQTGRTSIPDPFKLLWQGMIENPTYNGNISGRGQRMSTMPGEQRDGITETAVINFEFLKDEHMQKQMETSDFDLSALKVHSKGVSLFLSLPQDLMITHFRWLRLLINLSVSEITEIRVPSATGHRTLFVLDEFAGLEEMQEVKNAAAQSAGAGIKFMFIVQDLTQLQPIYKEAWQTFIGTSGVKLFFHLQDDFTKQYVSRQLGEMEVYREIRTEGVGQSDTLGRTVTDGTTAGEAVTEGLAATRGTSQSRSEGVNTSESFGTSSSVGASNVHTQGTSASKSNSSGTSSSYTESGGSSSHFSHSSGSGNSGGSWGGGWGSSKGWSRTVGSQNNSTFQYGTSDAFAVGNNSSEGTTRQNTKGSSTTSTDGTSNSNTTSQSTTNSKSRTESVADSSSFSSSVNYGRSEAVHKRYLQTPDEIGRNFARRYSEEASEDFPGKMIALIPGYFPLVVQRSFYFADRCFTGLFDPHFQHDAPPTLMGRQVALEYQRESAERELREREASAAAAARERARRIATERRAEELRRQAELEAQRKEEELRKQAALDAQIKAEEELQRQKDEELERAKRQFAEFEAKEARLKKQQELALERKFWITIIAISLFMFSLFVMAVYLPK